MKHRVLHYAPEKASSIINACTVLHNICISNNLPIIDNNDDEFEENDYNNTAINEPNATRANTELIAGKRKQQQIINSYFQ